MEPKDLSLRTCEGNYSNKGGSVVELRALIELKI